MLAGFAGEALGEAEQATAYRATTSLKSHTLGTVPTDLPHGSPSAQPKLRVDSGKVPIRAGET